MPTLVIFLHSEQYDRLQQAMSLLVTATSMKWSSYLFLFYGALGSYMAGRWDEVNIIGRENKDGGPEWRSALQANFETANRPSLYEMLETARGGEEKARICACSASCKMLGLDLSAVREKVDEIVGLPTMMQVARDATHVLYI